MVNYFVVADLPPSQHSQWRTDVHLRAPGVLFSEVKLYHVRAYEGEEEKVFLESLKTFNNCDHKGGKHRTWNPFLNTLLRLLRRTLLLGNVPLTASDPVNTPGHAMVLARLPDKKKNGVEQR